MTVVTREANDWTNLMQDRKILVNCVQMLILWALVFKTCGSRVIYDERRAFRVCWSFIY